MKRVLIVGGGASGVIVAINLCRITNVELKVDVAEPKAVIGQGLAYGTSDISHLLNVPAGRMSALVEDANHFVNWIGQDVGYFAPRLKYGEYLLETLRSELNISTRVKFSHIRDSVIDIEFIDGGYKALFSEGVKQEYDAVILSIGHGPALSIQPLEKLGTARRYTADPWRNMEANMTGLMLAIGTGLTFIDLALSHLRKSQENSVVGVSRNGWLPEAHLPIRAKALDVPAEARTSPVAMRRFIENAADWRAAQDGVRHELPDIWHSWSDAQKSEFLTVHLRWWNVHRHRMSPEIQDELNIAIAEGRLKLVAAQVVEAVDEGEKIDVRIDSGEAFKADYVINCLGYGSWSKGSITEKLIGHGLATPGPFLMGIKTNFPAFNVMSAKNQIQKNLYAIGPVLLGERFETTAIPEIREQAHKVATQLLSEL